MATRSESAPATTSPAASDGDRDSGIGSQNAGQSVTCIYIPKLDVKKYMQYNPEDSVWIVKQAVIAGLDSQKQLVESFNYGLYYPPANGRAGKFLDEERCMSEYPLPGSVGRLELKYKSRVYKNLHRPKDLQRANNKESQRKFMLAVTRGDVDKVTKFTADGLDPNFIDIESGGETPLTVAAMSLVNPEKMMQALVGGGAHLDFRNSQSLTAIHRAALNCNLASIKALLELGSSANYQDSRALTPLYYCISNADSVQSTDCMERLLYDHACVDAVDNKGCTPLHQVCKAGKVQMLDKLIYYGADLNAQNLNGNTPLHICAANDQVECARMLLFRGAHRHILNRSMFDAHRVASISQNKRVADLIEGFRDAQVVPLTQQPQRNVKRRPTGTLPRLHSCPTDMNSVPKRPASSYPALNFSIFTPPETTNDHASNVGTTNTNNVAGSVNGDHRVMMEDVVKKQQQFRTRSMSVQETSSVRTDVTVLKPIVPRPAQTEGQQLTTETTSLHHHVQQQQQQHEVAHAPTEVHSNNGVSETDGQDYYENINDCVRTAEVFKVFDDMLKDESATSSQRSSLSSTPGHNSHEGPTTDLLVMAERARWLALHMNTSGPEADPEPSPHAGVEESQHSGQTSTVGAPRPVPQQRTPAPVADLQSDEFKKMLEWKAAHRKMPDESTGTGQNSSHPVATQPVPVAVARPVTTSRAVSVDTGMASFGPPGVKEHPPIKQKPKSLDVVPQHTVNNSFAAAPSHLHQPTQRRQLIHHSPTISQAPAPAVSAVILEDPDLPPPPEEYCNLPPMPVKLVPTAPRTVVVPQNTAADPPVADWQKEVAARFARSPPAAVTSAALPAPLVSVEALPPPPPGFHDDVPAPAPARPTAVAHPPPPPVRTSSVSGGGSSGGGLANRRPSGSSTTSAPISPMQTWSRDDVVRWLEALHMTEHCGTFLAAGINGQQLIQLTTDDLYHLGVTEYGQRRMLERAIQSRGEDS